MLFCLDARHPEGEAGAGARRGVQPAPRRQEVPDQAQPRRLRPRRAAVRDGRAVSTATLPPTRCRLTQTALLPTARVQNNCAEMGNCVIVMDDMDEQNGCLHYTPQKNKAPQVPALLSGRIRVAPRPPL